jgi:hypothetical protein
MVSGLYEPAFAGLKGDEVLASVSVPERETGGLERGSRTVRGNRESEHGIEHPREQRSRDRH